MAEAITPMKAGAATLVAGISLGVIITFMMMQYFKSGFRQRPGEKTPYG